ncbi:MAG: ATP-binding protein, partial [Anaerolineaceae bacterium]
LFIDETELPQQFLDNYHKLIDQIRTTIYRLRPAMLNYGLYPALEDHFTYLKSFISPKISLITDIPPSTVRFDPDVELHLFRIIQESISNAIKHSQADQIIISGNIGYNDVWFTIEDNGIGMPYGKDIDLTKVLANNHFGIAGMFERAILIGAKILFNSLPPQGTRVSITLNLMD